MKSIRAVGLYLKTLGPAGLILAIRGKITRSTFLVKVSRKDCKTSFGLRVPSSDVSAYKQVFIGRDYDFSVKTQPRVIIDAGANIGLVSVYFANKYPSAKIIAIEPEKENFERLVLNAAAYPNIVPIRAALWHKNEEIDLVDPGRGSWGYMTEERGASAMSMGRNLHSVRATTVARIIDEFELDRVDILKLDIEGAEREVFGDPSSWIDKVDSMIIEVHDRVKTGCTLAVYNAARGFDCRWQQGEKLYLSRHEHLTPRPA